MIPVGFYLTPEQKDAIINAYINKSGTSITISHVNGPVTLRLTKTQMKMLQEAGAVYDIYERRKDLRKCVDLKLSSSQIQKQKDFLKEIHFIKYKNDLHCS